VNAFISATQRSALARCFRTSPLQAESHCPSLFAGQSSEVPGRL